MSKASNLNTLFEDVDLESTNEIDTAPTGKLDAKGHTEPDSEIYGSDGAANDAEVIPDAATKGDAAKPAQGKALVKKGEAHKKKEDGDNGASASDLGEMPTGKTPDGKGDDDTIPNAGGVSNQEGKKYAGKKYANMDDDDAEDIEKGDSDGETGDNDDTSGAKKIAKDDASGDTVDKEEARIIKSRHDDDDDDKAEAHKGKYKNKKENDDDDDDMDDMDYDDDDMGESYKGYVEGYEGNFKYIMSYETYKHHISEEKKAQTDGDTKNTATVDIKKDFDDSKQTGTQPVDHGKGDTLNKKGESASYTGMNRNGMEPQLKWKPSMSKTTTNAKDDTGKATDKTPLDHKADGVTDQKKYAGAADKGNSAIPTQGKNLFK